MSTTSRRWSRGHGQRQCCLPWFDRSSRQGLGGILNVWLSVGGARIYHVKRLPRTTLSLLEYMAERLCLAGSHGCAAAATPAKRTSPNRARSIRPPPRHADLPAPALRGTSSAGCGCRRRRASAVITVLCASGAGVHECALG
jgi:hypothetical protein